MLDPITIKSHRGEYEVSFSANLADELAQDQAQENILLIDRKVLGLHGSRLQITSRSGVIQFEALEENKDLGKVPRLVENILKAQVTKKTRLIVVGGGITQDMGGFAASMIFRGLEWVFYPTTLLAQADSCIGSKTSINVGGRKNQVGNFYPPSRVVISSEFLETLLPEDLKSGYGEIIKVHLLNGDLDQIEKDYEPSFKNTERRQSLLRHSLEIKKRFIEVDEFDVGERNLLNYGHTFGHALESATNFHILHGLAITVGMDIANFISYKQGLISEAMFHRIRTLLRKNFPGQKLERGLLTQFIEALKTDKKNLDGKLSAILTHGPGKMKKVQLSFDQDLEKLIKDYEES